MKIKGIFTVQTLAVQLGTSVAVARRELAVLLKAGFAVLVGPVKTRTRGRPALVYAVVVPA